VQFATVNDVILHHQLIGGPAGRPVIVFSNSLGTDFRIWRDVVVRLAGDFPIVTYDKRGHGLSDLGQVPYSIDDHVLDLAALLDRLDVKGAIICGLSVGGMIAQGLAAKRPDLVKALILCDTAHKIGTAEMWNARIESVQQKGIESLADSVMERWFTPAFRRPENAAYHGYRTMLTRQSAVGYADLCGIARCGPHRIHETPCRADALRGRRPGRIDAAGSRAVDGQADCRRALRGHQGCRAYSLCRTAGNAHRDDPRLHRHPTCRRRAPWLMRIPFPTATARAW
jgi:3-oxoadipate enol-lactonase